MVIALAISGCGDNNNRISNENNVSKNNGGTQAEKISEEFVTYTDSLGSPKILYLATVKNTDTIPLEFGEVNIDIKDSENNLIKHLDYGSVYPRFIMPGEYGYICEECTQLDETVDITKVKSAEMHFGTREADYKKPDVEFSQLEIKKSSYDWAILGKVKSNEDIEELTIALPIFDENGKLQTVALTIVENLTSESEKGFECSPLEYDPKVDFSKSKVEPIPYIY